MRFILFFAILINPQLLWSDDKATIPHMDYDEDSKAHGSAYIADAMYPRKEMPSHADWKPIPFFYKHCTEVGPRFYYSKTAYDCSGPP